jgi:hypothetical protein
MNRDRDQDCGVSARPARPPADRRAKPLARRDRSDHLGASSTGTHQPMIFASVPTWIAAPLFVAATCLLSLAGYGVARYLLRPRIQADTQELAASILFRIGALNALILALAFAQEQSNYTDVLDSVDAEVASLSDVHDDLGRYSGADVAEYRAALEAYVDTVANGEWRLLASGRLSDDAWTQWQTVYEGVLDLAPATPRQTTLRATMIGDLQTVADARKRRELATLDRTTDIFSIAAAVGLVLVMIAYFPFRPSLANLTLLVAYSGYTGLIFFFILAMSNPFAPPVALDPDAFQAIAAEWQNPPGG